MDEFLKFRVSVLENCKKSAFEKMNDKNIPATITDGMKKSLFKNELRQIASCNARLELYKEIAKHNEVDNENFVAMIEEIKQGLEKLIRDMKNEQNECDLIIQMLEADTENEAYFAALNGV